MVAGMIRCRSQSSGVGRLPGVNMPPAARMASFTEKM
jgi:hypothetical protein